MAGDSYAGPTAKQDGDHNTQHNHFHSAPPARAAWPHQVGVLPPRAGCFQDRAEAARLQQMLAGGGTTVVGPARPVLPGGVLAGLGGVGKTQLAADYVRTTWSAGELDVLVWVTAGTRTAVVALYAQAATEVLGIAVEDPDEAAARFLAWLEPKPEPRPCRWLVVLDGIADPVDLGGLWPPASPHGRTLATTRRRDAALFTPGRQRIEVGEFTPAEATDYLNTALATDERTEPPADIAALAQDLGCLPLALSQAAAYMIDAGTSCAAYRTLLADRAQSLARLSPEVLPDGQSRTMAAAWSLSVEYADRLRPAGLARPMLQLASYLDPNGIPADVLTCSPALSYLAAHRTPTSPGAAQEQKVSADDAHGALRALHRLSLLHAPARTGEPGDSSAAVRVHQMVQRATRDMLTPSRHEQAAHAAADSLTAAWPDPERDTDLIQALRACTTALTACVETALHQPDAHSVLFRAGNSLGTSGQVAAAIAHFQQLAGTTRHHLGPDHPDTLTARYNLARWRGEAGDVAGAAAATADLLADRERVQGPDHPDTLATRSSLADWRGEAGDAAGAAAAFADLLEHMVRVLGPDHPETLTARNNLASWRGHAGDAAGAAAAFADLLADRVRVLGPDHPDTLTTRSNLAHWRGEAGDVAGAAAATADLLELTVRVLGPDHPDTLTTRSSLAS
ncbi:tetratricopeptide repeat protein [Streptomyces sp. R35]|uniref:Tetratricopeptide repeat protein n=1 Tax=Streptomyces sp. R35 TaxID=3238630 RepID=A0AB39SQD0_9ACTN